MDAHAGRGRSQDAPAQDAPAQAQALTDVVTQLRRALRASVRADIAWEALPMAQVELMQSVAERSPTRVNDLAGRLRLANSTVSGLVGQLIAAGLIRRETDTADRRAAVVTLTDEGHAQLDRWRQAHERRIGRALDEMTPGDREAIDAAVPALRRLATLLSPSAAGG